ncbi:MAG: fasciclin domain-containing protein [Prolixibacteraceae bacterium]
MTKGKYFLGTILFAVIFYSCNKNDFDKYERPDWLAGKVYSQIKAEENLSTFTKCLELTEYSQVIDVSGSYTVFAPTDEAFQLYFSQHTKYKSVDDIPEAELLALVKYHIVQNPWSRDQLRSLDVNGWIDPEDEFNDKPRGYKRETLLLGKDAKYGIKTIYGDIDELMIVDTTQSSWHRKVATDSRKFAPIFFQEYFGIYNLKLSDYSFYFDRTFENNEDIYYVNGRVEGDEIFAENGFVYKIDRVVDPLQNAFEILSSKENTNTYSKFLTLVEKFPTLVYNETKTFDQPGADLGLAVDSLFDLTFPNLVFNITSEKTKAPASGSGLPSEVTIRFHHGLIAPTNDAFDSFVEQYVSGNKQWGSIDAMPQRIKKIITNTYFSTNPIYETDIDEGFYNGEEDIVRINLSDIVQKEYGSNCTFLGVNKAVVPRAFKSITGPIYRQPGYSVMMNAIEFSGLLSALKREGEDNLLFAVPDSRLRLDSSLFYNSRKIENTVFESFTAIQSTTPPKTFYLNKNDIRLLLLNQVAVESPTGIARKEFLKTLAGNYLIWDNINGTVKGTSPSKYGYRGSTAVVLKPLQISTDTDNGNTYNVDAWFDFTTDLIFQQISTKFPMFHSLLTKAGYALTKEYRYKFLSSNKIYTIFAPSDQALIDIQADTLSGKNLENFVKLHFVQEQMIFTDGKLASGYYKTACELPVPGSSRTKNAEIYLETGIDEIVVKAKNGNDFLKLEESISTNFITSRNLNVNIETNYPNIMATGVIHQIDKAFQLNLLDVQ